MEILGLSTTPGSGGAYALILNEIDGYRRLPIIIGSFEAQAIALELENIKPPRPMTHDLFKNLFLSLEIPVNYIFINDLQDGTFYSQIIFEYDKRIVELDARPSDAIALAVRFRAPIFISPKVLNEAGIVTESDLVSATENKEEPNAEEKPIEQLNPIAKLEMELKTAIDTENYEKAAKLRDQIQKLKG